MKRELAAASWDVASQAERASQMWSLRRRTPRCERGRRWCQSGGTPSSSGYTVADLTSTPLEPYGYLRLVDLGAEVDTMVANLAPGASVYVPGQSTLIDGG